MAILGTELTSNLSGKGDIKPTPHEANYKHHPASLTGEGLSPVDPKITELASGNSVTRYVDNLPR